MEREEKLKAIRARCVELREEARKRTPGKWNAFRAMSSICVGSDIPVERIEDLENGMHIEVFGEARVENATFIASSAGAFEASLDSTIAAIDSLEKLDKWCRTWTNDNGCAGAVIGSIHEQRELILTAWEGLICTQT